MAEKTHNSLAAVFITFSGNCKKALNFYQTCFGGVLQFETFETDIKDYNKIPVISGSLVSNSITIYGSDLVHNEGRKLGNYISIFLLCKNEADRNELLKKMKFDKNTLFLNGPEQKLIELTDPYNVRWILAV